jgi:hypothetical protein
VEEIEGDFEEDREEDLEAEDLEAEDLAVDSKEAKQAKEAVSALIAKTADVDLRYDKRRSVLSTRRRDTS